MRLCSNIFRCLAAFLLLASEKVQALPADSPASIQPAEVRAPFRDDFSSFNTAIWSCEYTCAVIEGDRARFRLERGGEPDTSRSWSKIRYKPRKFTSGCFTVRFSLTSRPMEAVWWGIALYDKGPAADSSQYNEINFGYTTNQRYTSTQLRFESSRDGNGVSLKIDTGMDLYDEEYHTATLEYDSNHVAFYLDGQLLKEITDSSVIPTDPVNLILGPRLVTGSSALSDSFTQSIDWVEIV
ncbi:hypothetical protein G7046_g4207 [Stylonectria norvegica]|nr:hypothetical protein G7046_g4207 [Stylonectria norvegica]